MQQTLKPETKQTLKTETKIETKTETKVRVNIASPPSKVHSVDSFPIQKKRSEPTMKQKQACQPLLSLFMHHSDQPKSSKSMAQRKMTHGGTVKTGEVENTVKKVLIVYSSGSVGARADMVIEKDYLRTMMQKNIYLCDYNRTVNWTGQEEGVLLSPVQANGITLVYKVIQFPKIQPSIYANVEQFTKISQTIRDNYQSFDSFIILSGFDVVCYIASAVSFMLQNLQKLVIFTGGYMPLSQMRNDSVNNLVQAFTIISECSSLGEVIIVSKNKGLRANRSSKMHQGVTDSIESPNFEPLIEVNIILSVNQHLFLSRPKGQFLIFTGMSKAVKFLKYHPYMDLQSLAYEIANPYVKGIVIESYGAANLPIKSQLLKLFKEQHERSKKIFINISQSTHATNHSIMASFLREYSIIYGGDMTGQAAVAKLSYLIGKGYDQNEISELMKKSLRGQLTQYKTSVQFQVEHTGFFQLVFEILEKFFPTDSQQLFEKELINTVAELLDGDFQTSEVGKIFAGTIKLEENEVEVFKYTIRNTNILHRAVQQRKVQMVNFLIKSGADLNREDQKECSPCFYALQMEEKTIIRILLSHGASVSAPVQLLMILFIKKLKKDSVEFFQLLYHMQFKQTIGGIVNSEGRSVAHLSILLQAVRCAEFLKNKFKLPYNRKDVYLMSGLDYAARSHNRDILRIFK